MEFLLFGSLIYLTVPVFYVIGLIAFAKWLANHGRANSSGQPEVTPLAEALVRDRVAHELRDRAAAMRGKAKEELLAAAEAVVNVAAGPAGGPTASRTSVALMPNGLRPATEPGRPAASAVQPGGITAPHHNMDNINLLLYLGAFLVVVSAGIFVGYNFSTLSGGFKTGFLALFAAAFYGTGLALYLRLPKLRPAGVTFTAIGLVLVPLVGLAAYNFTSLHVAGDLVWFLTSLLTLACYIATLMVTRQTYIAYLMAFTTLSLFESGIALFNVPVQWFGWGMVLTALVLLSVSRWQGWWQDAAASLQASAHIFVPVSLLLSCYYASDQGLGQLGVTIGLAGLFYGVLARRYAAEPAGTGYWTAALVALPAALGLGLWDYLPVATVAGLVSGLGLAYAALAWIVPAGFNQRWREILALLSGLLPLMAAMLTTEQPTALAAHLALAAAVNGALALRLRQPALALLGLLGVLPLPVIVLQQVMIPATSLAVLAAAYIVLAAGLVAWRWQLRGLPEGGDTVGIIGYCLSLGAALFIGALDGAHTLFWTGIVVGAAVYVIGYLERQSAYVYPSVAVAYLAALQLISIGEWSWSAAPVIMLIGGVAVYLAEQLARDAGRGQALRYAGLAGPFIGAFLGLAETQSAAPAAALAVGGILLGLEAYRQQRPAGQEAAAAVLLLSLDWYLLHQGVAGTQWYTVPWSAYFAALAYRRRTTPDNRDLLTGLALASLTFPVAGQALAADGQLYGLELILIALALVVGGMAIRYRLVTVWGAATLVAEVLYQLRDVFYALPKYVISALLGLALLAAAIVMLQRRKGD